MIAVALLVIVGVVAMTCGIVADSNHADTLTFLGLIVKTTAAQIFLAGAICTWALFAAMWLLSAGIRRSKERGLELRLLKALRTRGLAGMPSPAASIAGPMTDVASLAVDAAGPITRVAGHAIDAAGPITAVEGQAIRAMGPITGVAGLAIGAAGPIADVAGQAIDAAGPITAVAGLAAASSTSGITDGLGDRTMSAPVPDDSADVAASADSAKLADSEPTIDFADLVGLGGLGGLGDLGDLTDLGSLSALDRVHGVAEAGLGMRAEGGRFYCATPRPDAAEPLG